MIEYTTTYRVPYGQVDRMGFLYHSHYLELFDIGRTELMRSIGLTNLQIEEKGYMFPVCKAEIRYKMPAMYDDLLEIRTILKRKPDVTILFEYEIYRNGESSPITTGSVTLAIMNANTKRAVRPPEFLKQLIFPYFSDEKLVRLL